LGTKTIIVLVALLLIAGVFVIGTATLAMNKNSVYGKWLEVRNQYKRQADLIPNLVTATYSYLNYEHQTLLDVVEARAKALNNALTSGNIESIDTAGQQVNPYIGQILVVFESYPELKASNVVLELMAELAGTQNRISVARMRYNDAIVGYNNLLVIVFWGRLFGYDDMQGLEFTETPENPPEIPEWTSP